MLYKVKFLQNRRAKKDETIKEKLKVKNVEVLNSSSSLLAETGVCWQEKEPSAIGQKWLSLTADVVFADCNLRLLGRAHSLILILLSFIEPTLCLKEFKCYLSLLSSVWDNLGNGKIKKFMWRVVQGPLSFLNGRDLRACHTGMRGLSSTRLLCLLDERESWKVCHLLWLFQH